MLKHDPKCSLEFLSQHTTRSDNMTYSSRSIPIPGHTRKIISSGNGSLNPLRYTGDIVSPSKYISVYYFGRVLTPVLSARVIDILSYS